MPKDKVFEIEVVKTAEQRAQIEAQLFKEGQLYLDIWIIGLETGVRVSELLAITMEDVRRIDSALPAPAPFLIVDKVGQHRQIMLNRSCLQTMQRRLASHPQDKYLFQAEGLHRTGEVNQQVVMYMVSRVFRMVGKRIKPSIDLSMHSMRKTHAYELYAATKF